MNDINNENSPPAPEGGDAEEQRERQEADESEDGVPAVDFAALINDNETEARSSAADGRGSNLEWLDDDAVEANIINWLPRGRNDVDAEEERECRDIGRSHRLRASAVPLRDTTLDLSTMSDDIFTRPLPKMTFEYLRKKLIEEIDRVFIERCEVDASDTRPIWAVELKRYPDGHINHAKARFCIREPRSSGLTCLMRPPKIMEQRERQESNRNEERVSPVAFDALDDITCEAQSSATMCEY